MKEQTHTHKCMNFEFSVNNLLNIDHRQRLVSRHSDQSNWLTNEQTKQQQQTEINETENYK